MRKEFIIFTLVGTSAFVVDAGILYLLKEYFGIYWGRVLSFLTAVLATWLLNRRWTFSHLSSGLATSREFFVYLALMLVGGSVNYAVYLWLVVSYQLVLKHAVIGVAVGSLAGMLVNFLTSRFILFRHMDKER